MCEVSAAKQTVIHRKQSVDVICFQETHADVDSSENRLKISGFELISYKLHAKSSVCEKRRHGRLTTTFKSLRCCGLYESKNVQKELFKR